MRKKGMILICTLSIMIILTIFLMTAIYQTQSSTMVAKRAMWDIKSYWSAIAGSTIASDGCIRDYRWPEVGFLDTAGGYVITKDSNNIINAIDEFSNSKLTIYHKSKLLNNTSHESNPPSENTILSDHFSNIQLNASDEEKGEIYCLSVGKAGPTVVGLELVYGLYYNPNLFGKAIGNSITEDDKFNRQAAISAAGAIYVEHDLKANVRERFKVEQENGTRGYIVVGGNVDINNAQKTKCPPNSYGTGPVQLSEGAIFMGGNISKAEDRKCFINGTKIEPDNNKNITNYGLAVYTSPEIQVAEPSLKDLTTLNTPILPAGMFCFVEMPNEYATTEFDETVQTLFDVSLNPEDFYNIYCSELFRQTDDYNPNEDNTITINNDSFSQYFSESDIKRFDEKFEKYFEKYHDTIKQHERAESGFLAFLFGGEKNLATIKTLYRCYLLEQCSTILGAYKSNDGKSKYESFFIPNGVAGIEENNEKITLKYETFAKARALGDIAKKIKQNTEGTNNASSAFITDIYKTRRQEGDMLLNEKTKAEYEKIKENFQKYKSDVNFPYIAEEVDLGENKKCFVLNEFSKYVNEVIGDTSTITTAKNMTEMSECIANVLEHVTFESDNSHLIMGIGCHLQSNSSFKFATFERKDKYLATSEQQINLDQNPKTTSSLYVPKTEYIAKQSMPVEIMTKFLKLFATPVMARMQAVQMLDDGGGGGGYSGGYSHPVQLEDPSPEVINELIHENDASDYISAINRRAAIRLGEIIEKNENGTTTYYLTTENSITAKNIKINGFIYGTGHIASTQGDITFEAVGSGVDSTEENWVSIWSKNNIIIKRVSATKSTDSGENADLSTSDFRGILYSKNDLKVDVGSDNLDFTVSGAIICGHDLELKGIRNLKVEYDPDLSSLVLSKYIEDWDTGSNYIKSTFQKNSNKKEVFINSGKFRMFNRI